MRAHAHAAPLGAMMSVVSVIRSFFVRRLFNHLQVKRIL
jgi:hypothetical protein